MHKIDNTATNEIMLARDTTAASEYIMVQISFCISICAQLHKWESTPEMERARAAAGGEW